MLRGEILTMRWYTNLCLPFPYLCCLPYLCCHATVVLSTLLITSLIDVILPEERKLYAMTKKLYAMTKMHILVVKTQKLEKRMRKCPSTMCHSEFGQSEFSEVTDFTECHCFCERLSWWSHKVQLANNEGVLTVCHCHKCHCYCLFQLFVLRKCQTQQESATDSITNLNFAKCAFCHAVPTVWNRLQLYALWW